MTDAAYVRPASRPYPAGWRPIIVWMPVELREKLDAVTERQGMSAFVRDAIAEKIDRTKDA